MQASGGTGKTSFAVVGMPEVKGPTIDKKTGLIVEEVKDWNYWDRPNVLVGKIRGRTVAITFDPKYEQLVGSLKGANAKELGVFSAATGTINRFISSMSTQKNPVFPIFNSIRDVRGARLQLSVEHGQAFAFSVVNPVNLAKAAATLASDRNLSRAVPFSGHLPDAETWSKELLEYKSLLARWSRAGGPIAFFHLDAAEEQIKEIQKDMKALEGSGRPMQTKASALLDMLSDVNDVVEQMTRFAYFVQAVKPVAEGGLGLSDEKAALESKDLTTNFERKGDIGNWLNAQWMFSTAAIGGMDKAWRTLKAPGGAANIVASSAIAHSILTVFNVLAAGVDPETGENCYDIIPDYIKRRNTIIMIPGTCDYVTIPQAFVYNAISAVGVFGTEAMMGRREWGDAAMAITSTVVDATNPLGGGATLIDVATPSWARPIAELYNNRDWKGARIYPDRYGDTMKPNSQLYFDTVNPTIRKFTTWLNSATGGSELSSGMADVSPEVIEHLIGNIFGGAGKTVNRTYKMLLADETPVKETPLLRRLYGEADLDRHATVQYRHNINRVSQAKKMLDAGELIGEARALVAAPSGSVKKSSAAIGVCAPPSGRP